MRIPNEPGEDFEINILPMIDVIFSILAFFIISSLFLSKTRSLPVDLPSAQTAQPEKNEQISITIEADGDLFLDKQPIQIEELKDALQAAIPANSESLVVVNADENVNHGKVVRVMDRLRQVPGAKMAIAADPENIEN